MAKYLQRSCPKCNGDLGIVLPKLKVDMPVQAINERCLKSGYQLPLQRRIIYSLAYIILFSVGVSLPRH